MYAFIDCNRGSYTVEMMARVLRISPRSYYDYKQGRHNLREQKREALERLIQQVYAAAKGRYGAPRIAAEILAKHQYVSVNTVSTFSADKVWKSSNCVFIIDTLSDLLSS